MRFDIIVTVESLTKFLRNFSHSDHLIRLQSSLLERTTEVTLIVTSVSQRHEVESIILRSLPREAGKPPLPRCLVTQHKSKRVGD